MVPEVIIEPESDVQAEVRSDPIFKCTATSFRNITITWKRLHSELPETVVTV